MVLDSHVKPTDGRWKCRRPPLLQWIARTLDIPFDYSDSLLNVLLAAANTRLQLLVLGSSLILTPSSVITGVDKR